MSKHKSVWEDRFQALTELIRQRRAFLKERIIQNVFSDDFSIGDVNNIKLQIDLLDDLSNKAHSIETRQQSRIFLMRDCG